MAVKNTMATAEQIKSLIKSSFQDDKERLLTVALQVAAHEARQGHVLLAHEIRSIVDSAKSSVKVIPFKQDLSDLVCLSKSRYTLSDLILSQELKIRLERVFEEYNHQDKLRSHGLENRRKILLAGNPGTGKTMTAGVIAHTLHLPFYAIQVDKLITKFMGETSTKLRQIFEVIKNNKGVFLFDEFDAIGMDRGVENDVGEMKRVLNSFLQFIEQDESNSIIVAATNNLQSLDQALFRRFDDTLLYRLPSAEEAVKLIDNRLGLYKGRMNVKKVISNFHNLSHAEITQACDDAIKICILSNSKKVSSSLLNTSLTERQSAYKSSV